MEEVGLVFNSCYKVGEWYSRQVQGRRSFFSLLLFIVFLAMLSLVIHKADGSLMEGFGETSGVASHLFHADESHETNIVD